MKRTVPILILALFAAVSAVQAQPRSDSLFTAFSQLLSPEKVYLHTDREVYSIGDTIWVKGYLSNASTDAAYPECNYLYVELYASRYEQHDFTGEYDLFSKLQARVKLKRQDDGGFSGYIPLTEDMNTGIATVRAYSYWQLNGSPEYLFAKNIELRNPMKDEFVENLKTIRYTDQLTYDEIGVPNPFKKEILKRKPRSEEGIDLQFLPESGRYLPDRPSVVAVKAVNTDGLGVKVSGEVFADGLRIADFTTNDIGMGTVEVTVPGGTKKLTAVAETVVESFRYEGTLPLPEARAVVINAIPDAEGISIAVADAGIEIPASASLIVYDRTEIVFQSPYTECGNGKRVVYGDLRPGINNIAVVDDAGNVYAERPFFVFPKGKIRFDIDFDKPSYGKREKVTATVRLRDETGRPVDGDFSLAVTDEEYAPYSGEGHSIESWMLLGSELRGMIEEPQRYFCDTISLDQRIADMDRLLLTQGWRYYDLEKILKGQTTRPAYGKEYTQSLSGYVAGVLGKSKHATLCFMAPSIDFSMIADLDSTAYFALNGLDFPDSTQFIVGAQGKKNRFTKLYTPILNPDYFAASYDYPNYLKNAGYSESYAQYAMQSYQTTDGTLTYTIAPARITAPKHKNNYLSPFPNDSFKNWQYRDEKQMVRHRDYDLVSYIEETCSEIHKNEEGHLVGRPYRYSMGMTPQTVYPPIIIYLNGFRVGQEAIESVMISEVEAFVYLTGADAVKYDPTPGYDPDRRVATLTGPPKPVVLITTKFPDRSASNIMADKLLGWQKPSRFYAPKYETDASKKAFEPMRATLHWEPSLRVKDGEARFSFWTSDHQVPYRILLEGIAGSDCRPVSAGMTTR